MAWTAPRTWSVSEVVTAAMMNPHVRDNLKYLKGQAGAVSIEDSLMIGSASAPSWRAHVTTSDTTSARTGDIGAEIGVENTSASGTRNAGIRFRTNDTGTVVRSAARVIGSYLSNTFSDSSLILQTANGVETFRDVLTARGANVGIGTVAPASALHVVGTVAGTGFLHVAASAVTTIQTIAVAGTVTNGALFYLVDRANTGGALFQNTVNTLTLGTNFFYVNGDTISISVTAGGAITAARTSGTASTHNISMLVLLV